MSLVKALDLVAASGVGEELSLSGLHGDPITEGRIGDLHVIVSPAQTRLTRVGESKHMDG